MKKYTLAEQTAQLLIQMIQENGYTPGDKLPTEMELSSTLNVGRNTVREALRILMSQNVVTIRQGAGTFISDKNGIPDDPLGFSMVEDRDRLTQELLQIRVILEPSIAALSAQNASENEIQELEKCLIKMEEIMQRHEDYTQMDSEFHARIAAGSHNSVMSNLIPIIQKGVHYFAHEVKITEYEQTLSSHRMIFEAIRDRRAKDAEDAMRYHLLYNQYRYK